MPIWSSRSTACVQLSLRLEPAWTLITSAICPPTVRTGFREALGFWNMIAIRPPRSPRIRFSSASVSSSPSSRIDPPSISAPFGSNPSTDAAVRLLPEPDSPTSDMRVARGTRRLTPWRGMESCPPPPLNPTVRSSTASRAEDPASRPPLPPAFIPRA